MGAHAFASNATSAPPIMPSSWRPSTPWSVQVRSQTPPVHVVSEVGVAAVGKTTAWKVNLWVRVVVEREAQGHEQWEGLHEVLGMASVPRPAGGCLGVHEQEV